MQVNLVLPRTMIFEHFVWKRLFPEMLFQLEVTTWRKTQATVSTDLQHINNLFGLFLSDLEKETAVSFHRV